MKKLIVKLITVVVFFSHIFIVHAAPTVYIPLGSANKVIAVDAESSQITATFSGIENPHGLVATPDGEYLIAGSLKETTLEKEQPTDTPNSLLYLIHPEHGHVMLTIPVPGWTHHQAITPDGRDVRSTDATRGYGIIVDLQSNTVINTIKTGNGPNYTLVNNKGDYAYVSNSASGTISEIDINKWSVSRLLEGGPSPEHMAFSKDQNLIYVANPRAGRVSVISIKSGKVINKFEIGKSVHGLDISDDGKILFASSNKDNKLVSVRLSDGYKNEITLEPSPYHLNTIHGTEKVYVSSKNKSIIWVIEGETLKILKIIELPAGKAHQMAIVE